MTLQRYPISPAEDNKTRGCRDCWRVQPSLQPEARMNLLGIQITDWRPCVKGTLLFFFSATLPSGMVIHRLRLHQKGAVRWIGVPAREWADDHDEKQFACLITFRNRTIQDSFRDLVLKALDTHLALIGKATRP